MNDELPNTTPVSITPITRPPLEQRLAHRPDMLALLHELADTLEQSVADEGCTADMAEERVSAKVRHLSLEVLEQWAREANDQAQSQVRTHHPEAIQYGKKKR